MHEHLGQLRFCGEVERARSPAIAGKVVMKWVINCEGKVVQVTRVESQIKNATVEDCVAAHIKMWVFPKPADAMRLIACIEEPDVAKTILEHLGLRAEPLPTLRAQAPPVALELFHEA